MEKCSRRVEVMVAGVGWTPCKFADVVEGDTFRLFEEDGTPVSYFNGNTIFESTEDAYQTKEGLWCLTTKDEEV